MLLIRSAESNLNFNSLSEAHTVIFKAPFYQKAKKYVNPIKMYKHEQRCMTKFFFLQGKGCNEIYGELNGVLGEAAVIRATGANASKRATFPFMTKTGQADC
jgi:hypothetical protein